jgi:hypothetical protein
MKRGVQAWLSRKRSTCLAVSRNDAARRPLLRMEGTVTCYEIVTPRRAGSDGRGVADHTGLPARGSSHLPARTLALAAVGNW